MPHTAPSGHIADLIAVLEALPSRARLSDANTEFMYAFAYQLVTQGHFDKADRYFSILTLYRPTTVKFLAGAALCHKMLKRHQAAVNVYSFMASIEPQEPEHLLCAAECLLQQGKTQQASETVALVVRFCQENPGHEQTALRAKAIAALLSAQVSHAA